MGKTMELKDDHVTEQKTKTKNSEQEKDNQGRLGAIWCGEERFMG